MANGTTITDILNQWADFGVFAYVLPFLLIFAIIFGILNKSKILGKNTGVQSTIALSAALLALQFDIVSEFFANIFPYLGVGIAVLLAAVILIGLLNHGSENVAKWLIFSVGAITFFSIMYVIWDNYSGRWGFTSNVGSGVWNIVWTLVFIGAVIAITITSAREKDKDKDKDKG